jgi:LemA protein
MEWVILGIVLVLIVWLVVIYNRLVTLRQVTGQAWSDVDVQLKQRHDLIPNLVETVKGYAAHERQTLDAVIQARNAAVAAQAQGPAAAGPAEGALGAALGRLFALSEAYPDLKANQNFLSLQAELADIENKIAAARRFYNSSVAEYNAMTESIPAVFFARALGFQQRGFFEIPEAERGAVQAAPQVRFS